MLTYFTQRKYKKKIGRLVSLLTLIGIEQSIVLLDELDESNDSTVKAQMEEQIKIVYRTIECFHFSITVEDIRQAIESDKLLKQLKKMIFILMFEKINNYLKQFNIEDLISMQLPVVERQQLRGNIIELKRYFKYAYINPEMTNIPEYSGSIATVIEILNKYQLITIDRRLRPILTNSIMNELLFSKLNDTFELTIGKEMKNGSGS